MRYRLDRTTNHVSPEPLALVLGTNEIASAVAVASRCRGPFRYSQPRSLSARHSPLHGVPRRLVRRPRHGGGHRRRMRRDRARNRARAGEGGARGGDALASHRPHRAPHPASSGRCAHAEASRDAGSSRHRSPLGRARSEFHCRRQLRSRRRNAARAPRCHPHAWGDRRRRWRGAAPRRRWQGALRLFAPPRAAGTRRSRSACASSRALSSAFLRRPLLGGCRQMRHAVLRQAAMRQFMPETIRQDGVPLLDRRHAESDATTVIVQGEP